MQQSSNEYTIPPIYHPYDQNPNPDFNHPQDLYSNSHASAPPISSNNHSPYTYPPNPNPQPFDPTPYYYDPYDQNRPNLNHDPKFSNPIVSESYAPPYSHPKPDFNNGATNYGGDDGTSNGVYAYKGSGVEPYTQPKSDFNTSSTNYGDDDHMSNGVYAYRGGGVEPHGARGTGTMSGSSNSMGFDDYGRPINGSNENGADRIRSTSGRSNDVVKAIPKSETHKDVESGVQKFRVTLLAELGGPNMDVLCQVGLDGIRMLEPSTSRMLRIYPLETVTRCEVLDSTIFAFWSKSSGDVDSRRIRIKSNSYTTNTILDAVTAATFQLKEMDGINKPSDVANVSNQFGEKKKGLGDWMNLMKPRNEEKDHWIPDEAVTKCNGCATDFGAFVRRHHCRNCGDVFCDKCTQGRIVLTAEEQAQPVRVCDQCMAEVTQRLSNAQEASGQVAGFHRHEDLAKKLQEEMDRKRLTSSGIKLDVPRRMQMREVACPTCTVHLEVEVPTSGSKTIECSVCQQAFLVHAQ